MKLDATTTSERDKPIYKNFTELKANGFSLAPGICVFIASVHTAALVLGFWLYMSAPAERMWAGTVWLIAHFLLGSLSTTLYSHRLITHNAVKHVSLPVHLFSTYLVKYLASRVASCAGQPITHCTMA